MKKEPILVNYFCTSNETRIDEYLLREEGGRVYLCSHLTYKLAKKLGRTSDLINVDSHSLPKEFCNYEPVYGKDFYENTISQSFAEKNMEELLKLINTNFHLISRIGDFISYLYDYTCTINLEKELVLAYIVTKNYLPKDVMQSLFDMALSHFKAQFEENKFHLLLNEHIGEYVSEYKAVKKGYKDNLIK